MSGHIAVKFAQAADKDEIIVAAEGLSIDLWERAHFKIALKGPKDFREEAFDLQPRVHALIERAKPDLIVVCAGSPVNFEREFAFAGNAAGIPVVLLNDFWNGAIRLQSPDHGYPSLFAVVAIDEHDALLAQKIYKDAHVFVGGNPGVVDVLVPLALKMRLRELREKHDALIVFAGASTFDDLDLCVRSMEKTPGALIPRFHPKRLGELIDDGRRTRGDRWNEMIASLEAQDRIVRMDDLKSTDPLAVEADVTCAGFSTSLTTAAAAGGRSVVLWSEGDVKASLLSQVAIDASPHESLGISRLITEPQNLLTLKPCYQAVREKLRPYDPKLVYESIVAKL